MPGKALIWGLVMMSAVLSACNITASSARPVESTIPPAIATLPPVQEKETTTYHEDRVGFSFEYPSDWFVLGAEHSQAAVGWAITLSSFDLFNSPGSDGIPDGSFKVDVVINSLEVAPSFDTIRQRYQRLLNSGEIVEVTEEQITLPGGLDALVVRGTSGFFDMEFISVDTIINGYEVSVGAGVTSEAYVWQIANSLQLD